MGIFQLTGNLDSPFDSLSRQGESKGNSVSKLFNVLTDVGVLSESLVLQLLTSPTSTFVSLFLEAEVKWYAIGEDLNLIGRYESQAEAEEAGAVFVRRTPFNDFFALYENMAEMGVYETIEGVFSETLQDHASFVGALGEDADFFIDLCVYGQITMESSWDVAEDDSRGLWQINTILIDDLIEHGGEEYNSRSDIDRLDNTSSTTAVVDYYARIYNWIGPKIQQVTDHYGLNARDFLIPCLMDAYHCGPGKMSGILDLFIEMMNEDLFEGLEGQEVYNQMSRMYFEDGDDEQYGAIQRQYFYRAQAVAGMMTLQTSGYDVSQFRQDLSIE